MTRPRDNQKQRVYNAERAWWQATEPMPTVPEMQAFATKLVRSAWWKKRYDVRTVEIRDGRGRRKGNCYRQWTHAIIKMPRWFRYKGALLHELAHAATPRSEAAHGPVFVRNYLLLVRHVLGQESFEELLASFREHRVDWKGSVS